VSPIATFLSPPEVIVLVPTQNLVFSFSAGNEAAEESIYVIFDLPQGLESAALGAGTDARLTGMDGSAPVLELPDGVVLKGAFEETVGTHIILDPNQLQASPGASRLVVASTERQIVFTSAAAT
jgi:hypothetical protein